MVLHIQRAFPFIFSGLASPTDEIAKRKLLTHLCDSESLPGTAGPVSGTLLAPLPCQPGPPPAGVLPLASGRPSTPALWDPAAA